MIPVLFPADATDFTTNGIGALLDATKCKVTENRNGVYELALTYRTSGQYYKELECDRIILVKTSEATTRNTWQAFSIYSIEENLDGTVEVTAEHISYRANYIPIKPFAATGIQNAVASLMDPTNQLEECPFVLDSDIVNTETRFELNEPASLRSCLGGMEGSLLDRFSSRGTGEFLWDNFNIHFLTHRGSDKGYEIRYKKNLSEFTRSLDSTEIATGCLAYWTGEIDTGDEGTTLVTYMSDVQYSDIRDIYPVKKTVTINASEDFTEVPTKSQLNAYALAYVNELSEITESFEVDFYDPSNDVKLCDTVSVIYSFYNKGTLIKTVNFKAKVIKTVWNVLTERYEKITIGESVSDLAATLDEKSQEATDAAVSAVNNKMVSVYQYVDSEVGEAVLAIGEQIETLDGEIDSVSGQVSSISSTVSTHTSQIAANATAIQTKVSSSEVETMISASEDDMTEIINQHVKNLSSSINQTDARITSSVSSLESEITQVEVNTNNQIQNAISQQTAQFNTTINQTAQGINTTISEIRTQTDSLTDAVDKYEDYISIDTSINGITIGKANSNVRGKFDNDSLDFIDQNGTLLAWLASDDGLGANMLSVGSSTTRSQRWNIITSSDGNTLRFTRHS